MPSILWILSAIVIGFIGGASVLAVSVKVSGQAGVKAALSSVAIGFILYFLPGPFVASMLWRIEPSLMPFVMFAIAWAAGFLSWIFLASFRARQNHQRRLKQLAQG